jgi:hypothetical protein
MRLFQKTNKEEDKSALDHTAQGIPRDVVLDLAARVPALTIGDLVEWVIEYLDPEIFQKKLEERLQQEKVYAMSLGASDNESLLLRAAGTVERYEAAVRRGRVIRWTGEQAWKQMEWWMKEGTRND